MAEKEKDSGFKVSDRRLFTSDGELRGETPEEEVAGDKVAAALAGSQPSSNSVPPPPSAKEQQAQHDAYNRSARDMDAREELGAQSAKDLEVNFERFLASLYMTAMLQLGLMHEQGGTPQVDLIGARQTIDTIGLLAEKTKGNLTPREQSFLQNCLYELRMAYVEVTNALARGPQAPGSSTGTNG